MKKRYLAYCLPFLLASCIEEPPIATEKAVIEGWINSDGYPVVIFTSSISPDEEDITLSDKIIRWGKVTITDSVDSFTMTGGPDNDFFPPYRFISYQMKGEPGKTYKIRAEFKNLVAEAECTMPMPTPIDRVEVLPIEDNDSLRAATLYFTTPANCPSYYYLTIREAESGKQPLPAMLGTYKATTPGIEASIPILHSKNHLNDDIFVPQLKIGEKLEISLCRISEEVYEFWSAYDNAVLFGGNQFFDSAQSLHGNIQGGYGVWSAQGVSRTTLLVE